MNSVTPIMQNRIMSEDDYKAERDRIEAETAKVSKSGVRDQRLAELFRKSGWTQEALARVEGKTRQYIACRLRFSRFLQIATTGCKSENTPFFIPCDLSERKFRGFWEKTTGNHEPTRFRQVMAMIQEDTELRLKPKASTLPKGSTKTILEKFGDGAWHEAATIARHLEASEADVRHKLSMMKATNTGKCIYESKPSAKGTRYRIVRGEGKALPVTAVHKEIEPLLKRLKEISKSHVAHYNHNEVGDLAIKIESILEKLAQ